MDLFGPISGRHHDLIMVRESNINNRMRDLQIGHENQYTMYADKGYVDLTHLVAAYHGAHLTQPQIQINGVLSLVRVTVEWCFGKIAECQKYLDFPRAQQNAVAASRQILSLRCTINECSYMSVW